MNQANKIHWSPEEQNAAHSQGILEATQKNGKGLEKIDESIRDASQSHSADTAYTHELLSEINDKEYPKEMEVSLKGISVVTIKGDKGDSPTSDELLGLIQPLIPAPVKGDSPTSDDLIGLIQPLIPLPIKGDSPSKDEILSLIKPLIPPAKEGLKPSDEELVILIKPLIPKAKPGKNGSPDSPDEVVEKVNKAKEKIASKQVVGLEDVIKSVDNIGKFPRGGGGGGAAQLLIQGAGVKLSDHVTTLNFSTNLTAVYSGSGVVTITATGGTVGPGTINELAYFDSTSSIASLPVATYPSLGELSYVKGVTSAIQTQLDGKSGTAHTHVHSTLTSLTADDHTQYALLAGRAGGQTLIGGTAASNNLTLQSTSNATKGKILFGTSAYDEVNNRLGIGTAAPTYKLDVHGTAATDAIQTNIGLNLTTVTAPASGSVALIATPGNVTAGSHVYWVTYYTAIGETGSYIIGGGGGAGAVTTDASNGQVTVTIPVSTDPLVVGRKIYRTKAGTSYYLDFLLATVADNTSTTYVDNIADASLTGANFQSARTNTTSNFITLNGVRAAFLGSNTIFGSGAGALITTGAATLFGNGAGAAITSGVGNTLFGNGAGLKITTGGDNIAMGPTAMLSLTTGSNNIAIGRNNQYYNQTGSENVTVGGYAFSVAGNKSGNTSIGFQTLYSATTGSYNFSGGYKAGFDITTGSYNTILGDYLTTGAGVTTGSNNILIGKGVRSGLVQTGSNQLNIGNLIFGTELGENATLSTGNVGIGTPTPAQLLDLMGHLRFSGLTPPTALTATLGSGVGNVDNEVKSYYVSFVNARGESSLGTQSNLVTVVDKTVNGIINLTNIPLGPTGTTARKIYRTKPASGNYYSFFLATLNDNTTTTYTDNIANASLPTQQYVASFSNDTTTGKVFSDSIQSLYAGKSSVSFGRRANSVLAGDINTTAIGTDALANNLSINSTAVGVSAGKSITTSGGIVAVGVNALTTGTTGVGESTAVGYNALRLSTASLNTAVGGYALNNLSTGGQNTSIGHYSGNFIADGVTANQTSGTSVYLGYNTKALANGDTNEIVIGSTATGNGSNTATIGNASLLRTYLTGVNLKAGTATAGTGPLKFTSGPLLTTPEVGDVEFLNDAWYGTITTGAARKTFAFLESPAFTGSATFDTDVLVVDNVNNRVGLGTTSPQATLDINGSMRTVTAEKSAAYQVTTADSTLYVTTGATVAMAITLPAASANTIGLYFFIYKVDAGVGTVAITPTGTDTLNGVNATKLVANQWNGALVRGLTATSYLITSFTGL